jgi:hypothetical protein
MSDPFADIDPGDPFENIPTDQAAVDAQRGAEGLQSLIRQEAEFAAKPPPGVAPFLSVPPSEGMPARIARSPSLTATQQAQMLGIEPGEFPESRAPSTFAMDEISELRRRYPQYEFEMVGQGFNPVTQERVRAGMYPGLATQGPLEGKLVFRKRAELGGPPGQWTTFSQPGTVTMGDIASMAGSVPQTGGALILGGLAGARAGGLGAVLGAGIGGFGGELGRTQIGQSVFDIPPESGARRLYEAAKSGAMEAAAAQLGNYFDKVVRYFRSAGVPIRNLAGDEYKKIRDELADLIGEDAAQLLTASDVIAAKDSGSFVVAIEKYLRERGDDLSVAFLKRAREKEQFLIDKLGQATGGRLEATDSASVFRELDARLALSGLPEGEEVRALKQQLADLQKSTPILLNKEAIARFDDIIKANGGVPISPQTTQQDVGRAIVSAVGPSARQEVEAVGKVIHPDLQLGAQGKTAADDAFNRAVQRSREIMDEAKKVGGASGSAPAEGVISTLKGWEKQIERDIIPALSETDASIVKSALRMLVDEDGNPVPVTYQQLMEASSNLKASIRNGWTKEWNANLEMMADLEESIGKEMLSRLPQNLAERLTDANAQYYATKQAYRQAGIDKFLQRSSGGADLLSNSTAAGKILGNVETSTALSRLLTKPEDKPVRDTIKGGLLWDLDQRFIDAQGNVNANGLRRWIADNEVILKSWFTPDELVKIRNLETFSERRVALGIKPGDTYDNWFNRFWDMAPDQAQNAVSAIRRRLPKEEADKLVTQIQSLSNLKLRRQYISFDKEGNEVFDTAKFFNEMERGRADWVSKAISPGFGTRMRELTTFLREDAQRKAAQLDYLQTNILAASARIEEDKKAVTLANTMARTLRGAVGMKTGVSANDYSRIAEKFLDQANPDAARQVMDWMAKEAPELIPDFRRSILGAFYRKMAIQSETARGTTTGGRDLAMDVEGMFKFVNDGPSMQFLKTVLGDGADPVKAIADLARTGAILNPKSQHVVVTQGQNPALTALNFAKGTARLAFGVLSSEARIANSLIKWQQGNLQERAARALLDPIRFGKLVSIGNRSNEAATLATSLGVGLSSQVARDIYNDFEPRRGDSDFGGKLVRGGVRLGQYATDNATRLWTELTKP